MTNPRTPQRRVPAVLLVAVAAVLLSSCSANGTVTIDQSSPRSLVIGYLDAVVAGDTASADAVLTPDSSIRGAIGWSTSPPDLWNITVGEPRLPYQEVPAVPPAYAQVLEVPVSFMIDSDGSDGFSSGFTPWGFTVVRKSDREPWRIDSMGV